MPESPSDLLTPGEVAARFGVSVDTVAGWANSGRLACARTVGGHRRFRRDVVDALAASLVDTSDGAA